MKSSALRVELALMLFPLLTHIPDDRLVLRIGSQAVVVLVLLKPWIVHVSECHRPPQPFERGLPLAEHGVDSACPIGLIAVDHFFRADPQDSRLNLLPLAPGGVEKCRHDSRRIVARCARELYGSLEVLL